MSLTQGGFVTSLVILTSQHLMALCTALLGLVTMCSQWTAAIAQSKILFKAVKASPFLV